MSFSFRFVDPRHSFSTRLGLVLAAISLLLSLTVSSFFGLRAHALIEQEVQSRLAEVAFQMCDKLDHGMFERFREIALMTTWPVITDPQASSDRKRAVLQRLKDTYPVHAWIGLTDEKGVIIAGTDRLLEGKDVSGRPWFPGGLQGNYVGDVHGALLLSKYLPAPADGNLRFVDVAAPVKAADGTTIGVLCSHLTWEWAREIRDSLLRDSTDRHMPELLIVNGYGEVLLGPAGAPEKLPASLTDAWSTAAARGKMVQRWPDGTEYLIGFSRDSGYRDYPGLGWTVVVRERAQDAFAPARKLQAEIFAYGLGIGLLLSIAGMFAAWRIARPLRRIALAADGIRSGAGNVQSFEVMDGEDEIALLSRSLSNLLASLNERNTELLRARDLLELRVEERTAELQAANRELEQEIAARTRIEAGLRQSEEHLKEAQRLAQLGSFEEAQGEQRWSDELFRLLGRHPGEAPPSVELLQRQVHPDDRDTFAQLLAAGDDAERAAELRFVTPEGVRHCLLRLCRQDGPDGRTRRRGTLMDITERKRIEELRNDVERIIRHDLKTPLNAIITLPQIMLTDANLDAEQRENLQLIRESGQRMLDEINLSLKLYKIETGEYESEVEIVDVARTVRQVEKDLASLLRGKGLDLLFLLNGAPFVDDAALLILGERVLMQMMLSNLIKNAAEASPPGERITVRIDLTDAGMRLEIHNLGEVPAEIRPCFFEKYASRGKRGGTGLGTYTARLVALAHGGTIDFASCAAAGTTVSVLLPQKAELRPATVGAA